MDLSDLFSGWLSDESNAIPLALAAQGVGTYLKGAGSRKVLNTQNARMAAEAARQKKFQAQSDASVAAALPQFSAPAQEAARQALAQKYRDYVSSTLPGDHSADYITPSSAPAEVKDNLAVNLAKGVRAAQQTAGALANLDSYGGQDVRNQATATGLGRDIALNQRASQKSSDILPLELQTSYRKSIPYNIGSDIANGIGTVALLNSLAPKKRTPAALPGGVGSGTAPY